MLVVLLGEGKMNKMILPKVISGNYIISDKYNGIDTNLLEIQSKNNNWVITSDSMTKILNPKYIKNNNNNTQPFVKNAVLKEWDVYELMIGDANVLYTLMLLPVYEDNWIHLNIRYTQEILIGKDESNQICYESNLIANNHARIFLNNGRWMIENYDQKYGIFLNDNIVYNKPEFLFNGDIIFIMGLKIILMGNSIYINNPLGKMHYNERILILDEMQEQKIIDNKEEKDSELYMPEDYFYRSPRIINKFDEDIIRILPPPPKNTNDQMPMILTLGSTVCMGIMSVVSLASTISGIASGTQSLGDNIMSLISGLAMLICMLLIPLMTTKWEKKREKKYEEKRQKKYSEYISKMKDKIENIRIKKRELFFEDYATTEECTKIILNKDKRLWERTIEDPDFLSINLGMGNVPIDIKFEYPKKEDFSMDEEDSLRDMLENFTQGIETLTNAVVTISLTSEKIIAYIDRNEENISKFMQNIFIQLMAFQSYNDLKFVFLLKKDNVKKWDYIKRVPYVWNDEKDFRFFEDDIKGMEEISKYLEEVFSKRISEKEEKNNKKNTPYYLIITDDYRKIENLNIINKILNAEHNIGFSIFCIANDIRQLPNECKKFISINGNQGKIFSNEISAKDEINFTFNNLNTFFFEKIEKMISNIPIKVKLSEKNSLPNFYTFLEMYNVGSIEQLNILDRWKNNDATISLAAPIGIAPTGKLINLDIHEKFHGPHGLIAGSTGSGKSEFIITYILSLALNYHPDDVVFILIDYKGGGLAGAFKKQDIKLPHLVGTITNIDKEGLERSLISIRSEMKRRQIQFNEAREMTDGGTIDIYKYQKLYHNGVVKKPIPHLLIICDEFAELKQQQPDFMDELVSVSRIGRSLGVHLILATQKPSGIVDDQIRSNSKFAICLKVQDRSDSSDVIERPDAAYLKQSGRFYIKVGNDDYFDLGQSGWSGAQYYPSSITKKQEDDSVKFISNTGAIIKEINEYTKKTVESKGDQLTNIVKEMYSIAKKENITAENLWLDDISENIYVKDIKNKYKFTKKNNNVIFTIGEYDDPANQKQGIANFNLTKNGNAIIYGNATSGKETLLTTMVYDLMTTYTTDEVWMYILDFGTESLKIFKECPHVGEVILANDNEKLGRFFSRIQEIIKERKKILSEYNGDYNFFLKSSKEKMPLITIFVNGYDSFTENYGDVYDDMLLTLTREGSRTGVIFVVATTSSNDLRYRIGQNFKQKIALSLNDSSDYSNIFDGIGIKTPAHKFGRGLINLEENVYDFQMAKPCKPEDYNIFIKEEIERVKNKNQTKAEKIPVLPDIVKIEDFDMKIDSLSKIPIGLRKKDLKTEIWDFKNNFIKVITSKDIEDAMQFGLNIWEEINKVKEVNIITLDPDRKILSAREALKENYNKLLDKKENKKTSSHNICFVFGLDKFMNSIEKITNELKKQHNDDEDDDDDDDVEGIQIFESIIKQHSAEGSNYSFVIIDSAAKLKEHNYDEWYTENVLEDNIIWVGDGIEDQYLLDVNAPRKYIANNCGCSFGYINRKNQTIMLKLLEMKEKRREDE